MKHLYIVCVYVFQYTYLHKNGIALTNVFNSMLVNLFTDVSENSSNLYFNGGEEGKSDDKFQITEKDLPKDGGESVVILLFVQNVCILIRPCKIIFLFRP